MISWRPTVFTKMSNFTSKGDNFVLNLISCDFPRVLSTFTVILFCIWLWKEQRRSYLNGIPGPVALPVIGNLLQLSPQPHIAFNKMWKKYGDIYQIRMGSLQAVVINGIDLVRKAYTTYGEAFGARPDFLTFHYIGNGESLTFGRPKPEWNLHKKLARTAIRKHVKFSEGTHVEVIQKETETLVELLLASGKMGAFDPNKMLSNTIRSVTFNLIFGGTSNGKKDREYQELMQLLLEFNDLGSTGLVPDIFPWTRTLFKSFGRYDQFRNLNDKVEAKVQGLLEAHSDTMDDKDIRDIADAFLQIASNVENFPSDHSAYRFSQTVQDLMGGSESTMSSVLSWGVHLLSSLPDVQERAQEEIDHVIGRERLPEVSDRRSMPYMEATIWEILRYGCILPISLPHCTAKTIDFAGYTIPKDTTIFFNLLSVARDENQWDNAYSFDPCRFLNPETGRSDTGKKSRFLPFGAGRRRCLGQLIAEEEMFIIFATLLQRCSLSLASDEKYDEQGTLGLSLNPKPYKINVQKRL